MNKYVFHSIFVCEKYVYITFETVIDTYNFKSS